MTGRHRTSSGLRTSAWLAFGTLLAVSGGLLAQSSRHVAMNAAKPPAVQPKTGPEVEPLVTQAIKTMSDQLRAANSFSFTAHVMREEPATNGQLLDFFRQVKVQVQRPNKLHFEVRSPDSDVNLWYDGKTVTIMPAAAKIYTVIPAPPTIDATLEMLKTKLGEHTPLRPFLSSDPYSMLLDGDESGNEVGIVNVKSEQLLQLAFREPDADWQLWLTGPKQVLPHRMAIIYKTVPGQPRVNIEFSDWNLNAQIPASTFIFTKPAGAVEAGLNAVMQHPIQQGGKKQ
jgi:hypothetical protein